MPRSFTPYAPPSLSERVDLRTSRTTTINEFGQETGTVDVIVPVWAHRYDRRATDQTQAGAVIQLRYATFTIRSRSDVDEETVLIHRGEEYVLLGPPLVRGRGLPGHMELDCVFAT